MAIWQWDFWLVPEKELETRFTVLPQYLDQEWFEQGQWWDSMSEAKLATCFDRLLPKYATPWAKNTQSWGSDDGDRIELRSDKGRIFDLVVRLDLRKLNTHLLLALIEFARREKLVFYLLESTAVIKPDFDEFRSQLSKSNKLAFMKDPAAFFQRKKYLENVENKNLRKLEEFKETNADKTDD